MEHHFDRHFTLEEANALIPHVRKLFAEVRALLTASSAATADFQFPPAEKSNGNGHHSNGHSSSNGKGNGHGAAGSSHSEDLPATDYSGWSDEKRHEAAYRLLNALQSQGIVIQDVERGLIDFPSLRNGREVFLCYELNDGLSIQYFHEIEAGFAGRRLITENDQ